MSTITNSLSSVQQKTPTKRTTKPKKNKNKPIKVVYISNPLKVKTSASEFMALVQELNGQDAESPPDPSNYVGFMNFDEEIHDMPQEVLVNVCEEKDEEVLSMDNFEAFDDGVFTPQMIENISSFLPDSLFSELMS